MSILNLEYNGGSGGRAPRNKRNVKVWIGIGLVGAVIGIGSTLASTITINNGNTTEFGQGVSSTIYCGGAKQTVQVTPISSFDNKVTNTTINTNGNISFTKDVFINSTSGLLNTNPQSVSGASLNISGDTLLSGSNKIFFSQTGLGAPSSGSRSIGTKIVLRPEIGINTVDYAIGVETNNLWMSSNSGFKWYTLTNNTLNLNSSGCLNINCATNASGIGTGGSLNVEGGGSIKKDLYIGGSLYVNGQNSTSISGLTTIGSYSDTSVYQIVISIEKTMPNTNYKVIGNLTTISNNSNTYIVSFSNLTTTTFTANILRLDSLFSGWTDDNLNLSWTVLF